MLTFRFFIVLFLFLVSILGTKPVFAETTPYRSASWIETDGTTSYGDTYGCNVTDGIYCSRPNGTGYANLYFSSFGTLVDFGIPQNSLITKIYIRIKGKNNDTQRIYLDRERNKKPLSQLCQNPFDLWPVYLSPFTTTKEFTTTFTPFSTGGNNLANCFTAQTIDAQNYTFSIYNVENFSWSSDIDNFEIAFDYTPGTIPTPTPTPSLMPTPEPFLDLPWDYGDNFNDSALAINSYFDHEYPLLSSGLNEPLTTKDTVIPYFGYPSTEHKFDFQYSSHDGYDYGSPVGIEDGESVLAAASGVATYHYSSAGGNMIFIDHKNGYQTRYLHLQKDGLITLSSTVPKDVQMKEKIGKVGYTGNCYAFDNKGNKIYNTPTCAHIHFGVFEDKNHDGNFNDNVPDGATDPFGWQSTDPDPWENHSFFYKGEQRTGNKSNYLWTKKIAGLDSSLPSNGGIFNVGHYNINFPEDSTRGNLNLTMQSVAYPNASNSLHSLIPGINILVTNLIGDTVKFFTNKIRITVDFNDVDVSRFDLGTTTFSIYSSEDLITWQKETTLIDFINKKATAEVNHLTYFTLMADRIDILAPETTADLQGDKGGNNWFRSDVQFSLTAQDNEEGLGIDYTLYKLNEEDWQQYIDPLSFTTEGLHKIKFYSVDNDNNIEAVNAVEFYIDKTPPEAKIEYDLTSFDIKIAGLDSSGSSIATTQPSFLHPKFIVNDRAGNMLVINTNKIKFGKQVVLSIKNLQYNTDPVIQIDKNIFFTLALTDKNNNLKTLDQYFSLKDDKKIFTNYFASSNTTKIYTKNQPSTKYNIETRSGLVPLKLFTQKGTLKYSY